MTVPPARQNHPAARIIPPRLAMKIATYSDWQVGRSSSTDRVCLLAGVEPCNDGLSAQRFPASTRSNCGTAPDRVGSFRFHRRPDGKHQPPAQRLHIFGCRYEIVMRRIKLLFVVSYIVCTAKISLAKYPTSRLYEKNTTTGEAGGCAYAGIARGFLYTKS